MPGIFDRAKVDTVMDISQADAENAMRRLAREEGIFCGVSAGGSVAAALALSETLENATIVAVICDRGDRYLSSGVYA
jgi:cysteine synthase B